MRERSKSPKLKLDTSISESPNKFIKKETQKDRGRSPSPKEMKKEKNPSPILVKNSKSPSPRDLKNENKNDIKNLKLDPSKISNSDKKGTETKNPLANKYKK